MSGQLAIRWIANKLNAYFNDLLKDDKDRVVLIDTDSVVLVLDDLVQKSFRGDLPDRDKIIQFLNNVSEQKIQPYINKSYQELADYTNAYEQKMCMKRENLVDVMLSVGKKNYVMSVCDSEGVHYKEPKLKITGLQMVKSNTPSVIREKLRGSLDIILRGTEPEVQQYVSNYKQEFNQLTVEEIAFPRGLNNISKYKTNNIYAKGTPIHVRGALLYNHYLKKNKLTKLYPEIRSGDKIKFVYLKMPNPIREDCIAFVDTLPKEFGLHAYIDYNKMFDKAFTNGMQNVLDALQWSAIPIATIDDWFE